MDETLVHCSLEIPLENCDKVTISYEKTPKIKENATCYVDKRPFLDEFLEKMGRIFEISIFTSSTKGYADPIIDYIDPRKIIKKRFYREVKIFEIFNFFFKTEFLMFLLLRVA